MKLSDYVMQAVAAEGVQHVFLVPGGGAMHLNDSLGRCAGIEYVSCLHEQAVSIAAEAYARVTGNLGVAMVTTGPGGTNAVTGLAGAWLDSTPCLFLSGQVKRPDIKTGTGLRQLGVQEIDIVTIVESITKYAATVLDPQSIRFHLEKALYLAHEGRPGPVWIDIPLDVQAATIDPDTLPGFTPPIARASADLRSAAKQVIDLLRSSERPIIMAGNGIRIAGAVELFDKLIHTLNAPVQTTWLGLDLIAEDDPLNAQRPGSIAPRSANFALQNCDFFLSVGARLDMALTGYAHERFARAARKAIVDIDPAEIKKLGMTIDIPVVADARAFIEALLETVEEQRAELPRYDAWMTRIRDWKSRYPLSIPESSKHASGLSAYEFSRLLSDAIPEGALIVPGSSGFAVEIFLLMLEIKRGQRCFHNRGTGSMGFAIPSTIGACLAAGREMTVSVDGDGGFQFNIQELATIASLNLPIKFFVINNDGYASIRSSQNGYFGGNKVGCDHSSGLRLPPLSKLCDAYGIGYQQIAKNDDIAAKIRCALDCDGPMITEVCVISDEPREPRLSSARREDGSMVSKPLEDLFPFLSREEFAQNMLVSVIEE